MTSLQSRLVIALFQIGYVVAIIIYSILIEKYDPKYFIIYGALAAGVSGIIFVFFAQGILTALFLRMLSGIGIAGLYVPGVKILTGLFTPRERGKAIGIYVGSLVVGSGFCIYRYWHWNTGGPYLYAFFK